MTESEEMYLVTIARIAETGENQPVPVSLLASELAVMPVSVNQMIRKLEEQGWVCYTPYHGVELTPKGEKIARTILRHRRLWEVFLTEHLAMDENEASELACRLEHLIPETAGERLAAYLGHPRVTGKGLPIPEGEQTTDLYDQSLATLASAEQATVTRLPDDQAGRAFLLAQGIRPGATIQLMAVGTNGALLVRTSSGAVQIDSLLAQSIHVHK